MAQVLLQRVDMFWPRKKKEIASVYDMAQNQLQPIVFGMTRECFEDLVPALDWDRNVYFFRAGVHVATLGWEEAYCCAMLGRRAFTECVERALTAQRYQP